jgi:CBS domain-containing protein
MALSFARTVSVGDVMTAPVYTLDPEDSLKEAATLLASSKVSGAPVLDLSGKIVGILTEADILKTLEREADRAKVRAEEGYAFVLKVMSFRETAPRVMRALSAVRVREAMSRPVVTTSRDTPLDQVAREMSERSVNRMPVVEEDRLVGIVSRADIVRALVKFHLPAGD